MARKPSLASLTRQVRSLEQQRETAHMTIKRLSEECDEVKENADFWRRDAARSRDTITEATNNAKRYERERDEAREKLAFEANARLQAEAQLQRDRAYIEGLLDRQHPERPQLPWERIGEVHIDGNGWQSFRERTGL